MRRTLTAALVLLALSPSALADQDIRVVPTTLTFGGVVGQTTAAAVAAEPDVRVSAIEDLERKAREKGMVRVIAQLDVPFVPEGSLDAGGAQRQRSAIRSRQQRLVQAAGVPEHRVSRFETIPFITLEVDAAQLLRLTALPEVIDVQEDVVVPLALASSNTVIGAGTAWAAGFGGAGQTIAILDTGVDALHPYFNTGTNRIVSEACYSSNTGISTSLCPGGVTSSTAAGSAQPCPDELFGCFHGTHVAGIAAGNDGAGPNFGVARDASLIAIQVFSRFNAASCPSGVPCIASFSSDYIRGLERVLALRNDFRIAAANMSLGTDFTLSSAALCNLFNLSTKVAVDNLRSVGIATVIAAGNGGYRGGIAMPGCISSAISVGATDDSDNVAPFSNVAGFLSLLAPGVGVTSAMPGGSTARFQGTSMATPHVAGMWALMRQANPAADVPAILAMLRENGTVVNDTRIDGFVTNMRRINASAALPPTTRTFTIHNDGDLLLFVASINRLTAAPWISWAPTGPLFLPPGASQPITVSVDLAAAPVGESTTRLIVDSTDADESPYPDGVYVVVNKASVPIVTLTAPGPAAAEGSATTGSFTVTRSGSTSAPLTVGYFLGGTATAGADYTPLSGTVTVGAGSSSASIDITVVDDTNVELDETVVMGIATSGAYVLGPSSTATVTIASDDLFLPPPANVVATAISPASVSVSWAIVPDALGYRVYRSSGAGFALVGSVTAPPLIDASAAAGTSYLYKVRSFVFTESADSNVDVATTVLFSSKVDPGIVIRASHFTETLDAVNAVRSLAGAGSLELTPAVSPGVAIARQHVVDLRGSLDAARVTLGLSPLTWTDPAISAGSTIVRAVHLTELRDGVK